MNIAIARSNQKVGSEVQTNDDYQWKGLYRLSAVLLIITAVIWTIVSRTAAMLYAQGYPADPEAYLQLVARHQALASITWGLWIVSDFLLIAPTVTLYLILRSYDRALALFGSLFAMFFNIYDVSVTELNSLTLVSLSQVYLGATNEVAKASTVSAAAYGFYGLPWQTVLSFFIGTFGYLLWCLPMAKAKGIFRRGTAIFGAIVMVIALIGSMAPLFPSSVILGLCQFVCIPACALWFVLVGLQLFRYGSHVSSRVENPVEVVAPLS
jgi:hypothetical protein